MEEVINYLLERATGDGIIEAVLIVLVLVSVEIVAAAIIIFKVSKVLKSRFNIYAEERDEEIKRTNLIMQNEKNIIELRSDMNDSLTRIETIVEELVENDEKQNLIIQDQLAHSITSACNKILDREEPYIKASELQTILRLYNAYSKPPINGNSFVHILVKECIAFKIVNDGTEGYISEYMHIKDELDKMD